MRAAITINQKQWSVSIDKYQIVKDVIKYGMTNNKDYFLAHMFVGRVCFGIQYYRKAMYD